MCEVSTLGQSSWQRIAHLRSIEGDKIEASNGEQLLPHRAMSESIDSPVDSHLEA